MGSGRCAACRGEVLGVKVGHCIGLSLLEVLAALELGTSLSTAQGGVGNDTEAALDVLLSRAAILS